MNVRTLARPIVVAAVVWCAAALFPQEAAAQCAVSWSDTNVSDDSVSAEALVGDYYNTSECGGAFPFFYHEYSISIQITCGAQSAWVSGSTSQYGGGGFLSENGSVLTIDATLCDINISMVIWCSALSAPILEVYQAQQVSPCTLTIDEETISPGGGALPVRNPARVRTGFAPVFEVSRSRANCPVTWSIASGPGSIVGSTTSTLVTVNGNSVGTIQLRATTDLGRYAQIAVPVVDQQNVDVRAWIVRDNNGANPATTDQRVNDDVSDSNEIWVQCGIQFNLVSISYVDNANYLTPSFNQRDQLRNLNTNTGAIEVYYVDAFSDITATGVTTADGIVIRDLGNTRTAAHEIGHAMGLGHGGTADLHLMHTTFSALIADIKLSECDALVTFASN